MNSEIIKISSPEVIDAESLKKLKSKSVGDPVYGEWVLKINNDSVPFTTIYKDSSNAYCIEDFTLPEEYIGYGSKIIYDTNSTIYGSITSYINDFSVQMIEGDSTFNIIVDNNETYAVNESGEKIFRIAGSDIGTGQSIDSLGNTVYIYRQALNDVTNDFYQDEIYFGYIDSDNILYKDD